MIPSTIEPDPESSIEGEPVRYGSGSSQATTLVNQTLGGSPKGLMTRLSEESPQRTRSLSSPKLGKSDVYSVE